MKKKVLFWFLESVCCYGSRLIIVVVLLLPSWAVAQDDFKGFNVFFKEGSLLNIGGEPIIVDRESTSIDFSRLKSIEIEDEIAPLHELGCFQKKNKTTKTATQVREHRKIPGSHVRPLHTNGTHFSAAARNAKACISPRQPIPQFAIAGKAMAIFANFSAVQFSEQPQNFASNREKGRWIRRPPPTPAPLTPHKGGI